MWRHGPTTPRHQPPPGEAGTVMLEVALLLPVAMFVVLLLLQVTLLMVGRVFVHYAATSATRTAIVQIPRNLADQGHDGPNWITPSEGDAKYDAIHTAASYALIPVSGRLAGNSGDDGDQYARAMAEYLSQVGGEVPAWVDNLLADRHRYAFAHTRIDLLVEDDNVTGQQPTLTPLSEGQAHRFGPREAVTVRVRHRLNLAVPYVKRLFADGRHSDGPNRNYYTLVSAQATLNNKGDTRDLPPEPPLPRRERN